MGKLMAFTTLLCLIRAQKSWFMKYVRSIHWMTSQRKHSTLFAMQINFENRFVGAPNNARAYVSLDATDCPVEEPTNPDEAFLPRYFSHKLHGAGLRYEIGLNIRTCDLVWVFGGFLVCGSLTDLGLARELYVNQVEPGEMTLADDGYNDINYFIYPAAYPHLGRELKAIAQRHETVNNLLKRWAVLKTPFQTSPLFLCYCSHHSNNANDWRTSV